MIKTIAIIAAIIVVAVAALLVYAATRPDSFRVQRTVSIKAPPERIFALIDDFRQWRAWSPYEEMDPAMERTLSGAASGKGAVYAWRSAGKPGEGRMEITEFKLRLPGSRSAWNSSSRLRPGTWPNSISCQRENPPG